VDFILEADLLMGAVALRVTILLNLVWVSFICRQTARSTG